MGIIITDALTFDSNNYDKIWKIKLFKNSELINEQNLMMYSSTPLIIYESEIAYNLTQTQVSQLYVSIFGRASEGEGNAYWSSEQEI